jgi:uncharacterized protein with GYD domain
MPRYISLIQFTDKGAREIQNSTSRGRAFVRAAQKAGVTIEAQYWTLGSYDGVLVLNGDDETQVLRCLTRLSAFGNVRTQTLRAFVDGEWDKIVAQ